MHDGSNDPETLPLCEAIGPTPARDRRTGLFVCIGAAVGLAVGVLLTVGVYWTYTLFTQTLPSTRDSLLVFNELNELRQQINALNEEKKLQEKEQVEALRSLASKVRPADGSTPEAMPSAKQQTARAEKPARKPGDPFADIDAEIENLQQTSKVLNSILDLFTAKRKEPAKER